MAEDSGEGQEVRVAFRLGYIGTGFAGSQFQPDQRTVEGEIIAACVRAGLISDRKISRLALSGRTDRGVHARSQIMAFSTKYPERAVRALNGQLPPDIWVSSWSRVDPGFYPRYDVMQRTYRYYFPFIPENIENIRALSMSFLGCHDFSCFARVEPGKNPVISVDDIRIEICAGWCWLTITAWGFLWHMVRSIANALLMVSEGSLSESALSKLLDGKCHNKVKPAPPDGLILWDVKADIVWREIPLPRLKRSYLNQNALDHLLFSKIYSLLLEKE